MREHPDWTFPEYAQRLSEENWKTDERAPAIKPEALRRYYMQHRAEWEHRDGPLAARGVKYAEFLPPPGVVAAGHVMDTPLRYAREIAAHRRGDPPLTDSQFTMRRKALNWERTMRDNKTIVDLTDTGVPVVRQAMPTEMTGGELIDVVAWVLPGWKPPARKNARGRA